MKRLAFASAAATLLAAPTFADSENCPEGSRDRCFKIEGGSPPLERYAEVMHLSAENIRAANPNIDFTDGMPSGVWIHDGTSLDFETEAGLEEK